MLNLLKNIGFSELVIIALVLAVVFGGQRVKQLASSIGESTKEIKRVKAELDSVKADVTDIVGGR